MRIMSIGAFGALLLSVSLAHGQASQSTLPPGVSRTVISAAHVILRVPDLDKTKPAFTATTTTVTAREVILSGNVVVQIDGAHYTADQVVISREGEIRFDGNVQVERPAPAGGATRP